MTQWYGHKQALLAVPNCRPLALSVRDDRRGFPTRADVQMTPQIIAGANPLGIAVHDHIIVGKEGHAGLKGPKLI
ncbi:MAG TPA: JAB domain-containing protein [Steroidobacteraceae bacterium]|nr:JAB domain-containing protein [Steroidobacteraceae bacterium]